MVQVEGGFEFVALLRIFRMECITGGLVASVSISDKTTIFRQGCSVGGYGLYLDGNVIVSSLETEAVTNYTKW